ncbi:hypothetical protein TNCV_2359811 [Trichonephila clavipes]|nr:hypothetical protein TNCV_2359811 [Trichonephila clavipes]
MAPYRRKTPAPTDYTTDEEDMITYNVEEDELEEHPNLVQKEGESNPVEDETDGDEDNNNNESSKGSSNADAFSALEITMEQ